MSSLKLQKCKNAVGSGCQRSKSNMITLENSTVNGFFSLTTFKILQEVFFFLEELQFLSFWFYFF